MATVAGDPDMSAVRVFDTLRQPPGGTPLAVITAIEAEAQILPWVRSYGDDAAFREFQGSTVGINDLEAADQLGTVWLGSHLFHHWARSEIDDSLFSESLVANQKELDQFRHTLPVVALPYGDEGQDPNHTFQLTQSLGTEVILLGRGGQNPRPGARLDRVWTTPSMTRADEWWYATHRLRLKRVGRRS